MTDTPWTHAFHKHIAKTSPEPIGLVVDRAEGPFVYTTDGKRYLDLLSGIGVANIGHAHPRVIAAVERQNRRHHHVMVYGEYIQEEQALYAQDLAAITPKGLDRVYFTNSGAEAVEGALKTARKATGRAGFVAFEGAYHGDTFGALSVAGNASYQIPFEPLLSPVKLLPFNEPEYLEKIDEGIAAVIVEPVQGEGGVRIPTTGFMTDLAKRCQQTGALLILDEVMTGFGRTGKLFALEHWGITPDLLVLAKALGGGYPLGAFIGSAGLLETLTTDPPLSHVTTFGGHPVSCAAGRAGLSVIQEEKLVTNSRDTGAWFLDRLQKSLGVDPRISEIRGLGMFIGIQFVDAQTTRAFTDRCREEGLLLGWTLHHDHVVRLAPPLVTGQEILEEALGSMIGVLKRL